MTTEVKPVSRTEAVRRACKLDGWLNESEAAELYDLARAARGPIVEIGSYRGRSTAALALGSMAGAGHPVYAIDPFIGAQNGAFQTSLGNAPGECSAELLRANLDAAGVNGLVRILPVTSREAASTVPDCAVLFVDGCHEYPAVREDLDLYLPKVLPGGSVMLHDVTEADPGVPRAIDEVIMTDLDHWRLRGRVGTAIVVQKSQTQRHKVHLAFPGHSFAWGPVSSILHASVGRHDVEVGSGGAAGWDDFNYLWARGLNAFEAGEITHFAMLHSDIEAGAGWIDVLLAEMDDLGADLVSSVVPIKDDRGVTSTGSGCHKNHWGAFRRYTLREVMDFPATFSQFDTPHPARFLLHNTGCWVADLRNPKWFETDAEGRLKAWFDFPTKVQRNKDGKWVNERESEDWFFSRQVASLGLKTFATRKVKLTHMGGAAYSNQGPYGKYGSDVDTKAQWGKELEEIPVEPENA